MILFGVNTSDSFLWRVVRFTTTLKWTNSHIHDAGRGIVGIGHVFLKALVKDERLRPACEDELFHIGVTITSLVNMHTHKAICVRTHHLHSFAPLPFQNVFARRYFRF